MRANRDADPPEVLYLDTSAALRAVLEHGISPEIDRQISVSPYLITSRLSIVESARVMHRLRARGVGEQDLADIAREIDSIWARCTIWELNQDIMRLSQEVAPEAHLRSLDAIHLATFIKARRTIGPEVLLVTADHRLEAAAAGRIHF
jgi:predicted nucleic acid-binding protein